MKLFRLNSFFCHFSNWPGIDLPLSEVQKEVRRKVVHWGQSLMYQKPKMERKGLSLSFQRSVPTVPFQGEAGKRRTARMPRSGAFSSDRPYSAPYRSRTRSFTFRRPSPPPFSLFCSRRFSSRSAYGAMPTPLSVTSKQIRSPSRRPRISRWPNSFPSRIP